MSASPRYLWFRSFAVKDKYQSAVLISGLVTFIAAYHYIRIFNSWVDSYEYHAGKPDQYGALFIEAPTLTGVPFNDAYRYMDWLLTVPLLLIEILLVMKLPDDVFSAKAALSQALLKNVQKLRKDARVAEGPPLCHGALVPQLSSTREHLSGTCCFHMDAITFECVYFPNLTQSPLVLVVFGLISTTSFHYASYHKLRIVLSF